MMKYGYALALLAVLATGTPAAARQADGSNRFTVQLTDSGRPATLDVRMMLNGGVTITPHDAPDIVITARGGRNVFESDPNAEGLRRLTAAPVNVSEENNVVTIRGDALDSPSLVIQAPARTHLKLRGMNGDISVEGIEGDIEVDSLNGRVRLTGVSGSVVAHAQNGGLEVSMNAVAPDKLMAFSSLNGNVDVTLPASTRATLRMSTLRGDIYTDFDVQLRPGGAAAGEPGAAPAPPAPPTERADRLGRPVPPAPPRGYERSLSGTVNGGGPEFEFRSLNGNIYIRRGE